MEVQRMFENKRNDQGDIMCPGCDKVIVPDGGLTSALTTTPKGMFIIHKVCMLAWNERALLHREVEGRVTPKDYAEVEALRKEIAEAAPTVPTQRVSREERQARTSYISEGWNNLLKAWSERSVMTTREVNVELNKFMPEDKPYGMGPTVARLQILERQGNVSRCRLFSTGATAWIRN